MSAVAALALIALMGASVGASAPDTAAIDVRHRAIAVRGGPAPADSGLARPRVGVNTFLEQEVEPAKRQRSLELLRAAGIAWIRQELPWEQIETLA